MVRCLFARYIQSKKGKGKMAPFFGQFPISRDPEDDLFLNPASRIQDTVKASGDAIPSAEKSG
jgi:hypothetical protein